MISNKHPTRSFQINKYWPNDTSTGISTKFTAHYKKMFILVCVRDSVNKEYNGTYECIPLKVYPRNDYIIITGI